MKRPHLPRTSLVGLLIAAVVLLGLLPSALPARAAASLNLPRTTVPQAASVAVSGTGFTAQDTVVVYVDAPVSGHTQRIQTSVTTDGGGSFTTHLNLPRQVDAGAYTLTARDSHGLSSTQHLTVLALLVLRVNGGNPATTVVDRHGFFVDALGFKAGETVQLQATYPTYSGNNIVQNRTATADAHGNVYNVSMYAPNDVKAGWSAVTAAGQSSNSKAQGRVYVAYQPYVFLNRKTITAGSAVQVNGRGFVANTQVRIQITIPASGGGTQTLTFSATADNNGDFTRWITIPGYTGAGTYTVTMTDLTGGFARHATLAVNAKPSPKATATATPKPTDTPTPTPKPTAAPTYHPTVRIFPATTLPNQDVSVTGQGFPADISVTVSITFSMRSGGPRHIGKTAITDSNGSFATALRVPYKAAAGTYSVTVSSSKGQGSANIDVLPLSAHPKNLSFRWSSLWYHTVRQGTWDYLDVQSTLNKQLGIWVHVIFPNGQHYDYYTNTDNNGHWAIRFTIPAHSMSRHSNLAYVTFQLWHGKQTTQAFIDFTLV